MRVGVLGAGLSGTLVALELADAGHDVMLMDRKAMPLAGASGASEGKIHLGYVYAADRSRRTAWAMAVAAGNFRALVERWIGRGIFDRALSSPFIYAVPRDSMIDADVVRHHFEAVSETVRAACGDVNSPECMPQWRQLAERELCSLFDPVEVAAAFATEERAVHTDALCGPLRSALAAQPRIDLVMGHHVESVSRHGTGFTVATRGYAGPFSERFDVVVNALWEHRLRIDATLDNRASRAVVHRFKYGLWSESARIASQLPSVTFLVGPYGDCVSFSRAAYACWYPAGLASQEVALCPSQQDFMLTEDARARLISDTLRSLCRLMPGAAGAFAADPDSWAPRGGFITAWGRTGIDDAHSELHERYQVGVHSDGNWHSIDTGKLTMAPMFASDACSRILALHRSSK